MNAEPPGEHVAVSNYDSRSGDGKGSKAELIQMQKIRACIAHDRAQIFLRRVEVLFPFLHPVETKCSGMIFEAVKAVHPSGLMGKRNFAKAYERDLGTLSH